MYCTIFLICDFVILYYDTNYYYETIYETHLVNLFQFILKYINMSLLKMYLMLKKILKKLIIDIFTKMQINTKKFENINYMYIKCVSRIFFKFAILMQTSRDIRRQRSVIILLSVLILKFSDIQFKRQYVTITHSNVIPI